MTNNLDLYIESTSLEAPALKIKGNLFTENALDFVITFGGSLNDNNLRLEKFISDGAQVYVVENTVNITTSKSSQSFEATLVIPQQQVKKLKKSGKFFVQDLIGSYFPFQANHIKLSIKSIDTRIVATFALPSDQIAISKSITPGFGHFAKKDKKDLIPYYTFQSDSGMLEFEMVYRFRPFPVLKLSTLPILIMYGAALAAAGIPKLSGMPTSMRSVLINVPMTGNTELTLLGLLSLLVVLLRVTSTINTGITTRSWMLALKGVAATFLSLLIIDAFRVIGFMPIHERLFFIYAYDLFLKFGTAWTSMAIIISLFIYPFTVSKSKRNNLIFKSIILSIILCVILFLFFPIHPVARLLE